MISFCSRRVTIIFALAIGLALVSGQVWGEEEFHPPDIADAKYLGSRKKDVIHEIVGAETIVRWYERKDGSRFTTWSISNKGGVERIFGYDVDVDGKPPWEITVVDVTGEGEWKRLGPSERIHIPNGWLTRFHKSE